MTGLVQLFNAALGRIGAKTILSPTEQSPEADVCYRHWEQARDEVLLAAPWSCVKAIRDLTRIELETSVLGYEFGFQLPVSPKVLYILNVINGETGEVISTDKWERMKDIIYVNVLYSSAPIVQALCIEEPESITQIHPHVKQLLVTRLCSYITVPLTQNVSLKNIIDQEYGIVMASSMAIEGKISRSEDAASSWWDSNSSGWWDDYASGFRIIQ